MARPDRLRYNAANQPMHRWTRAGGCQIETIPVLANARQTQIHSVETQGLDQSERIIDLVIELAVEIGREGRVGHPIGTIFVVGDAPTVCRFSSGCGVDPFFGYGPNDRDLFDPKVREDVKEIARLDGAFIIDNRGLIERSRQIIEFSHEELMITITTTRRLGARHWVGAAITRKSNATAVVVSQSTGSVRVYREGRMVKCIDPPTE